MSKVHRILIVDDHPFIIEAYKNTLKSFRPDTFKYSITQASNCREAYDVITEPGQEDFDYAFLDISMPPYEEMNIYSGEDLAKLLKNVMPECKIILLTMHSELVKIHNIIKDLNPNGMVIKNDLTFDELLLAFNKIVNNENYYSQTVVRFVSQSQHDPIHIDDYDRQILQYISKGVKTKDLTEYIPLSLSAIEKRKVHLKDLLKMKGGSDVEMVTEAKSKGLI
ncbi:MAG: response regulator [Flavobacterium sp.]